MDEKRIREIVREEIGRVAAETTTDVQVSVDNKYTPISANSFATKVDGKEIARVIGQYIVDEISRLSATRQRGV